MNERERRELAADIAARVRMFSWSPMPEALAAALGKYDFTYQAMIPASGTNYVTMRHEYRASPPRLTLSFDINGIYNVGQLLWTPEHDPTVPLTD